MTQIITPSPTVAAGRSPQTARAIIDCDVHHYVNSIDTLMPYLPLRWQRYVEESGFQGPPGSPYPKGSPNASRIDAIPPNGGRPGSDLPFLRAQLLEAWGMEYAVLNCLYNLWALHNEDFALALAQAVNDWTIAEWLEKEPRLRSGIVVPINNPELAATEIDRLGGHPGFVHVLLPVRSEAPYGRRRYRPIFAAAARHGLPVGIHFGGTPGNPITACGWPSYYIEDHTAMSQAFQAQLLSLVCEGVFEEFPSLKVVLLEGGFGWLPPLIWRLNKNWKGLRREVPWVRRLPGDIIREHVRLSTQPMEEPEHPQHFHALLEMIGSDEMLLFATDYPHWDFDSPDQAFPVALPPELERKIYAENARAVFRFT
jgi:predicted TIM-barrel fold metal-dependent hydrolase